MVSISAIRIQRARDILGLWDECDCSSGSSIVREEGSGRYDHEHDMLLGLRPIQGIVRVFAWLGNEDVLPITSSLQASDTVALGSIEDVATPLFDKLNLAQWRIWLFLRN